MPYNENVPRESNNRGDDLISMQNNFKYIKDAFKFLFYKWSDNTTGGFRGNTSTGFTHHITGATIDFPVNNMQNKIAFMCGNKDTVAWFYMNAAPPGWKIETGGGDKVLAIRKDTPDDKAGYPAETKFAGNWIIYPSGHAWLEDVPATVFPPGTGEYKVLLVSPPYPEPAAEGGEWRPAAAVGIVCRLDVT